MRRTVIARHQLLEEVSWLARLRLALPQKGALTQEGLLGISPAHIDGVTQKLVKLSNRHLWRYQTVLRLQLVSARLKLGLLLGVRVALRYLHNCLKVEDLALHVVPDDTIVKVRSRLYFSLGFRITLNLVNNHV